MIFTIRYNGEIYYSDFASGTTTLSASDGTVSGTRIVHQDNALRPLATSMKYGATFNGEYYYLQQYGIVKTDGTAPVRLSSQTVRNYT